MAAAEIPLSHSGLKWQSMEALPQERLLSEQLQFVVQSATAELNAGTRKLSEALKKRGN